jgi:hypothetical protein
MSNLNPNMCAWLLHAWIHIKSLNIMICKGWEKIGLLRRFNMHFLLQAMEVNTITTIFLITFNLKLGHKKKQDDID